MFRIKNNVANEHTVGFMKWFDSMPGDLLEVHRSLYGDLIQNFFEGKLTWKM